MIRIHLSMLLGREKMTQKEFAAKMDVRAATINEWFHEHPNSLKISHLNDACRILDCKIHELLEYIPDDEYARQQKEKRLRREAQSKKSK